MQPKMNFLREVIYVFGVQIICFVLGVLGTVVIARVLGPSGKGMIAMLTLIPGVFALIGRLGIGSANVYFTPKLVGAGLKPAPTIISNSLFVAFVVGGILWGGAYVFRTPIVAKFVKGVPGYHLTITLISVPFLLFINYSGNILRGMFRFKSYNLLNLTRYGSRLVFILWFILILRKGVFGGAILIALSSILTALFGGFACIKGVGGKFQVDFKILKDSLSYGIKGHIGNVIDFLTYRLDVFFVSFFVGMGGVGIYTLAVAFAELLFRLPDAINIILFPKASADERKASVELTSRVSRIVFPLSIIIACVFVVIAKPLILLIFGDKFLPCFTPFWILLFGVVPLTLSRIFISYLAGRGKIEYVTYRAVLSIIITIVLDILLIPRLGIAGAAIASSVSYISATAVVVRGFLKDSKLSLSSTIFLSREDISILRRKSQIMYKATE